MARLDTGDGLIEAALAAGFDQAGIAAPDGVAALGRDEAFRRWLAAGRHGGMDWMAATAQRRADPRVLWPEVRSILVVAANYAPLTDPMTLTRQGRRGVIAAYARMRDYHDVMKGRLKVLAGQVGARTGLPVKVFVDTAPVLEKPLAQAAGLGWQGKHTNLVSRRFGSWLFLGSIFLAAEMAAAKAAADGCGACRRCLDACPTGAFPQPYELDARRCLAYLTIEHAGPIPVGFRAAMGNRVYGCDDCLAVCPWNKFASAARDVKLSERGELAAPDLAGLAALDDAGFRARFAGTPVKRIGRGRFLRNVMIAIGNSGDAALAPQAGRALDDGDTLVRGMAVWALGRLDPAAAAAEGQRRHRGEADAGVRREWEMLLSRRAAGVDCGAP